MQLLLSKTTSNTSGKKRPRSHSPSASHHQHLLHMAVVTSLLCLVALTTTTTQAFVLASDRPSPNLPSNLNNKNIKEPIKEHAKYHQPLQTQPHPDTGLYSTVAIPLNQLQQQQQFLDEQHGEQPLELDFSSAIKTTKIDEDDVLEWASRFTSVEALREHFGTNQNKLWGDLQASTARRLYKTLLPRALLELSKLEEIKPEDLAPLAYQARLAAKIYARERCTVPARIAATLFDGFRQWMKYGKFQGNGMTFDQLWEKYAEKILHETEANQHLDHNDVSDDDDDDDEECGIDDCEEHYEEISEQVCRKIIERACVSNEGVDSLVLNPKRANRIQPDQQQLLEQIKAQLEHDMYQLLVPGGKADVKHHPAMKTEKLSSKNKNPGKFWRALGPLKRPTMEEQLKKRGAPRFHDRSKLWIHNDDDDDDDDTATTTATSDDELDGLHP